MQLRVLQTTTVIKISSKSLHLILPGTQRSGLNQSVTQISWENSSTARVPFLRQRCKTKWFVDNCTVLLKTRNSTRREAGDEWRSIHRFVCFLEFEYVIVKIRTIKIITWPWQWKSNFLTVTGLLDEVFALLYGYIPLTPIFIQWLNLLPCMCLSWLHLSHFHECPKIN